MCYVLGSRMPIPIQMLRDARRPLTERILGFLSRDVSHAYTLTEIYMGVQGHDPKIGLLSLAIMEESDRRGALKPFTEALAELEKAGKIEVGEFEGVSYYAFRQTP
jgi:hypothetical protein